ncbi:hypothetical protein ACQR2L_05940 [Clostridium butyricum]|uniref:Uncharacterized protein n=1 Tax=Clostridium butyricum TaxID=1492 RepID=A0A2S7F5Q1_CLOBU|nr:hypothetical protein [Clostridium butyricum]KHD13337.1 hypothetical protein OA81_21345 [Clostridium butyricum]PPV12150.1 hypothetical protein AWN73_19740 [Clostridium butyricum]
MRKIDVNEEIIVFVIYNGTKNWYISDKEIWFLDKQKRINLYSNLGYEIKEEYIDERRKNLLILDTKNADIFLSRIKKDKVLSSQLREALLELQKNEEEKWRYNYMPSLYIDFDKKELLSMYSEPASYEDYVPFGWKSDFRDFNELIPKEYFYWK